MLVDARAQAYDALRAKNRDLILATNLDTRLPNVVDDSGLTGTGEAASCASLYASSFADGAAFTSLVSVDIEHPGPVNSSTIVSRGGAIYASSDSLYMAVRAQLGRRRRSRRSTSSASPTRAADTHYLASGVVTGRVLNQFAMDETDGYLRVATTDGHVPRPDARELRLDARPSRATISTRVGAIGGIAPSEDIRSVRFDGDRGVHRHVQEDRPAVRRSTSRTRTRPKMLGELKIPGFSTYMHMLDDDHLLTIGYDADDHGSFAFFDGVMLQIFDVTEPDRPDPRAQGDHRHARLELRGADEPPRVQLVPGASLLALPMTICEGGDDGSYGTTMTFTGLMVFDASVASGFAEHGRVPHSVAQNVTCGNWWTNADVGGEALAVPRPVRLLDLGRRAEGPRRRRAGVRARDRPARE